MSIISALHQGGLLLLNSASIESIAVIGQNADKIRLGGYSGTPTGPISVLEGIRRRAGSGVAISYAEGVRISEPDSDAASNKLAPYVAPSADKDAAPIAEAVEAARKAQVVELVLGGNETITREAFADYGGAKPKLRDTDDLELPGRQKGLLRQIAKLGKPTIAVVLNGRPYSFAELAQTVPPIVEGWYLGQEAENSVAGVLFGDVNPSGKLPGTIARNVGQLPVYYHYYYYYYYYYYMKPQTRPGYVFNDNKQLYPFGYGLSYTTFTYGKPTLDRRQIGRNESARASAAVTNSGARVGDEIVQMYIHTSATQQCSAAGTSAGGFRSGEPQAWRNQVGKLRCRP